MNSDNQEGQTTTMLAPKQQTNVLNSLLLNTKFTDVSLFGVSPSTGQQGGKTLQPIRAHKNVLAAASTFFDALFSNNGFADSHKDEYTLNNVSHEILKLVVEAVYTGKVSDKRIVTEAEVACDMLESFKYFLMDELALACEDVLIKHHLTVAKCIQVWKTACKYADLLKLTTEVESFIAMSLPELILDESFLHTESADICRMMLIESVKVSTSADLRFRAVFAWLDHDYAFERRNFSDDVLATIPLTPGKISRDSLKKACSSNALTEVATKKVLELLSCSLDAADVDFLVEPDIIVQASPASGGSLHQNERSAIFCVGGEKCGHEKDCLKYNVLSKTWQRIKLLPEKRFGGGSCVVGDQLMLFGGNIDGEQSSRVFKCKLSPEDSPWEFHQTFKLKWRNTYCLACSVGDTAYVCGGSKTLFEYMPHATGWKKRSCMITSDRAGSSIVYSQASDAVYVAGGEKYADDLSVRETQIDKFDVKSNDWETVGFAKTTRKTLGTSLCGDTLYLIGGQNTSKSVETFNIRTGKAYRVPDLLHERRSCQGALLYNNVVCVFGGNEKSVEAFDVREGKWTTGVVVPDMPFANSMFSLAWK